MRFFFLLLVLALFVAGCSTGGSQLAPILPEAGNQSSSNNQTTVNGISNADNDFSATGMLGQFELVLNPANLIFDLHSKRENTEIGDSYIVSGAGFFNASPCSDCLKIKSVELTEGNDIEVNFNIEHPFEPGDIMKPPTWLNRLDLDVFDVALVVHPKGFSTEQFELTGVSAYSSVVGNASGYTKELKEVTGDDSSMPYVLVVDDDITGTSTFNEFSMGEARNFSVLMSLAQSTSVTFDLYLTMGYGHSAKKPQRLNPRYFNPEFNRKSAWKVNVTPPEGDSTPEKGNTWDDHDSSSMFPVTVEVFDWQINASVNPNLDNTSDIYSASEVASVSVEIPGMTNSLAYAYTASSGNGLPGSPLVYSIPIANERLLPAGEYTGIVKVTDERIPSIVVNGSESGTLVHTEDGIILTWFGIPEYATYQIFTATVVSGCGPITGSITYPSSDIDNAYNGQMINFTAQASSDNGGDPIIMFEWDKDYDGITFNVDATGSTVNLGPFTNPYCSNPPANPVTYPVAVRAIDSCAPPNVKVLGTRVVTVSGCLTPYISNPSIEVNRVLSALDYPINSNAPFTLRWNPPITPPAQYAIYVDRNPSDGLMNNMIFVGTSTTTSYTVPSTELPSTHYLPGNTYVVRARTVAGDPSSEGPDSEPMHVIVSGFETLPNAQTLDGEGWLANCEGTGTDRSLRPQVSGSNRAHGQRSVEFSKFVGLAGLTGRWNGMIYGPLPKVPMSSVRFIDFSVVWENCHDGGVIIGTCSTKPANGWTSPQTDFHWSSANSYEGFYGYTGYNSGICTFFNGCPSMENNCWYIPYNYFTHNLVGGNCNEYGNPNDDYLGIECFRTVYNSTLYSNVYVDEVAITIY